MPQDTLLTFSEALQEIANAKDKTLTQVISKCHFDTSVSIQSIRAAHDGWRVLPETATNLSAWATKNGKQVDVAAMITAPKRSGR